jgi:hypothetical protein
MREKEEFVPKYIVELVEGLRRCLHDPQFVKQHRCRAQDFTRQRCLTFSLVMLLVLQKTVKSIQRHLNEFLAQVAADPQAWEPVTPRAWTKARAKLRPSAFVELNNQCVLPLVYAPEQQDLLRYWHGHRLLGFDSSVVSLPYSPAMAERFQVGVPQTQEGPVGPAYCKGRISVVYDLLNRIGLDARLVSGAVGEVALAIEQLAHVQQGDLVLNDCGYTGYEYLVCIRHQRQAHFVARCSPGSFLPAQELFRSNRAGQSVITRIFAPPEKRAQLKAQGLPLEMEVRFISVRLPEGGLEVLVTSLLDEAAYPTEEFGPLYHCRWGQETYHFMLKSRLDLENWSSQSPEAVEQDFAATVLLCNLESLLSRPAQKELDQKSTQAKHPQQVNRALAYHALKTQLLDLLASQVPAEQVVLRLQRLFACEPVRRHSPREVPRRKFSWSRSYRYRKSKRKIVF